MPLITFDAMRQAYFRDVGAKYGDVLFFSRPRGLEVLDSHPEPMVVLYAPDDLPSSAP